MQTNGLKNRFQPTLAVIGAGISGLTCARTLADHGVPVTVFEKSRGVGGRMATRRSENGVPFDRVRGLVFRAACGGSVAQRSSDGRKGAGLTWPRGLRGGQVVGVDGGLGSVRSRT